MIVDNILLIIKLIIKMIMMMMVVVVVMMMMMMMMMMVVVMMRMIVMMMDGGVDSESVFGDGGSGMVFMLIRKVKIMVGMLISRNYKLDKSTYAALSKKAWLFAFLALE